MNEVVKTRNLNIAAQNSYISQNHDTSNVEINIWWIL